jgi:hypothetical protein
MVLPLWVEERAALARAALDQFFVGQAPVILVFCAYRHQLDRH